MQTEKYPFEAQTLANKFMFAMAAGVTKEVSSLSTWFIAGAGALLAVVINGAASLMPYFQIEYLSDVLRIFIGAAAINVIQRWIGAMVAGSVSVLKELQTILESGKFSGPSMFVAIHMIIARSILPVRWAMRRSIRDLEKGDLIAGGALVARLSQIQSVLLIPQFALLGLAAWLLLP